jgi:hypothetical protein
MMAPEPPRPCDRRTRACDMCDEAGCDDCLLAPQPQPAEPCRLEDMDPDVRESAR